MQWIKVTLITFSLAIMKNLFGMSQNPIFQYAQ